MTSSPSLAIDPPYDGAWLSGISLRKKITLLFTLVNLLILGALVTVQMQAARSSVYEEISASNRVATQLLSHVTALYANAEPSSMVGFLNATGRVRANEISLRDQSGALLYASPPSAYKAGRDAPAWYAGLITPRLQAQAIPISGGTLIVSPNPSRSVLDAWDELKKIIVLQVTLLLLADVLLLWILGRWLTPLGQIQQALRDIARGHHAVRLPPLAGKEAAEIGHAFNRMAQAVEDNYQVRQASAEAQARLAAQRDFTGLLHQRIEEERTALARELHDEFGQSLTAVRSIAKSMRQHPEVRGSAIEHSAQMLFETAGSMADALQRMIPRLRPIQLDGMGLVDALRDLISELQLRHPQLKIDTHFDPVIPAMPDAQEISLYRIAQEALTNVIRHADATQVVVTLRISNEIVHLTISDNGKGAKNGLVRAGHYGVRGMQERAESLSGTLHFRTASAGGLEVDVSIPVQKVVA